MEPEQTMFVYYVDVNEEGHITGSVCGERVIPDKQYDFYFYLPPVFADKLNEYKVKVNAFKTELVEK